MKKLIIPAIVAATLVGGIALADNHGERICNIGLHTKNVLFKGCPSPSPSVSPSDSPAPSVSPSQSPSVSPAPPKPPAPSVSPSGSPQVNTLPDVGGSGKLH